LLSGDSQKWLSLLFSYRQNDVFLFWLSVKRIEFFGSRKMSWSKRDKWGLAGFITVVILVILFFFVVITKMVGCMNTFEDGIKTDLAKLEVYNARFAAVGETIEVDGKKMVILKKYMWSQDRRYQVRLADGSITDVMGSEIIDVKPIEEPPPE